MMRIATDRKSETIGSRIFPPVGFDAALLPGGQATSV